MSTVLQTRGKTAENSCVRPHFPRALPEELASSFLKMPSLRQEHNIDAKVVVSLKR